MKLKTAILSGMGAGIEYYDFAIFAIFSTIISTDFFPKSYFPTHDELYLFLIFALSYLIRPVGGFIFGYVGDKYGRKTAFFCTMLSLMSATFSMAMLPNTAIIGTSATVAFILLRCIQGLAIGGEIPTAVTFNIEHYPQKEGFAVSIIFAGLSTGSLMTSLIYMLLNYIPETSQFYGYRWRIAFIIGALLSFLTYHLRKSLYETTDFKRFQEVQQIPSSKNNRNLFYLVVSSICIIAFVPMTMTQIFLFLPTFLNNYFGFHPQVISKLLFLGSITMIAGCLLGGFISDYLNKNIFFSALIIILLLLYLSFYQQIHQFQLSQLNFSMICFFFGMLASTYTVIIAKLFTIEFRCRGVGLSYNLSYLLFSAPIPALSIYLINCFKSDTLPLYMLITTAIISFTGLIMIKPGDV